MRKFTLALLSVTVAVGAATPATAARTRGVARAAPRRCCVSRSETAQGAMRKFTLALLSVTVAVGAATPATAARTVGVALEDFEFSKPTVTIKRGDRVRWTWKDGSTPHDVTSRGKPRFRS